jgi:hypothetical protein
MIELKKDGVVIYNFTARLFAARIDKLRKLLPVEYKTPMIVHITLARIFTKKFVQSNLSAIKKVIDYHNAHGTLSNIAMSVSELVLVYAFGSLKEDGFEYTIKLADTSENLHFNIQMTIKIMVAA